MAIKKIIKWFVIIVGLAILVYASVIAFAVVRFSNVIDPIRTKQELIDNYLDKRVKILELKRYFKTIVPADKKIEIEFESTNKLSRFGVSPIDTATGKVIYPIFLEWDLETNSAKIDSVFKTINWTQETLKELKNKLDEANCIQIESGEPTKIGWQRSGMGMYSYNVFDNPVPNRLLRYYNDSCTYIMYSDKLVLEYGGGAVGPQCFPKD